MQSSVIFAKEIEKGYVQDKRYCKIRDHCHYEG